MAEASLDASFRMRLSVEFEEPLVVPTAAGERRILNVARGSFAGPELEGDVVQGGDWVVARPGGEAELDIRFCLQARGGALLYLRGWGLFSAPADVLSRIRAGAEVPASDYYFRTTFFVEGQAHGWPELDRRLLVGTARRTRTGMVTDVFSID